MLEKLPKSLKEIVSSELEAGNIVAQVDRNWPESGCINVFLRMGFSSDYSCVSGVAFTKDSDPHNPIEQYTDLVTGDCVFTLLVRNS